MCTQSQLNEILTKTVEEAKRIFASAFHGAILFEYGIVLSIVEKDIATYEKYREALPFYRNIEREGRRIA